METDVSNFEKFRLLFWKNWILQWNNKCQLVVDLLLPAIFMLLLVLVRTLVEVEKKPTQHFEEFSISSIEAFKKNIILATAFKVPLYEVLYSPTNPYLDNIVRDAVKSLRLGSFKSFANAEELENSLTEINCFAGIQFDDSLANINDYPEKLNFSLRFPSVLRTQRSLGGSSTWETFRVFPVLQMAGPRNPSDNDGGIPVGYVQEGFVPLQHAISMAYLKFASKVSTLPEIQMQRYPYPPYIADLLLELLVLIMAMILLLSYMYPCIYITRYIATEKEKQLKEIMKIMGLPNWIHWAAWFFKSFLMLSISSLLIVVLIKVQWTQKVPVLAFSSWSALFFFLLVYTISSIFFCFMVAVFFSKASTAAATVGLIWFIAFIPFTFLSINYNSLTLGDKLGFSLISNTAMALGVKIILGFEGTGEGLQWNNIFTAVNVDDSLTLGAVMLMMLISSVIYMIICLYVEQIFPGDYGVPRKWYFPLTRRFWCDDYDDIESENNENNENSENKQRNSAFEKKPEGKRVGLQVKNLKKRFGNKWAVKGITMNMYEDEITVLLGHNGAGKTTTISMLVGMFPPTSGTAIINGIDIRKNLAGARKSMGICPQHNVLFDDMSVANHIVFFSRLKGVKGKAVQKEVDKYLKMIQLENKANKSSAELSGGMKRKLSLCCALCGGTKVVFCDEPSSGMDPAARRQLWDLLQKEKDGRSILLTTHFMDEADILGDHIAIMYDGELKCGGTPFFLKKKYGSGYRLICVKLENCNISEVTSLLDKYIPNIKPESDIGAELTYLLPDSMSPIFKEMFADLEENSERLGLSGYGIGVTSLEEVFMKVGAENQPDAITNQTFVGEDIESTHSDGIFSEKSSRIEGLKLFINQWEAMLLKKILNTWRHKILFLLQNIMPIFFVIVTVLVSKQAKYTELPPLAISLKNYPTAVVVLETAPNIPNDSIESKISNEYNSLIKSYGSSYTLETTKNSNFSNYILKLGKKMQVRVNSRYVAAATISSGKIISWLNNQPLHTAPMTLNLVHNAMAKSLLGSNAEISVTNHPLPYTTDEYIEKLKSGQNFGAQMTSNICFCMGFVTALYILSLIKESQSRAKLLQFVGGVRVLTFWFTQFLWDLLTFAFTAMILVITLACFQQQGYSKFDELARVYGVLIIFGFAALPFTYLASSLFKEPSAGFAKISIFNIFTGLALYMVINTMSFPGLGLKDTADNLQLIFRIFPHFSLAMALNKMYVNSRIRDVCNKDVISVLPDALRCQLIPTCCSRTPFLAWESPGVLPEVFYMLVFGLLIFIVIILREYRVISKINSLCRKQPPPTEISTSDEDIIAEENRILAMSKDEVDEHHLVLDRVTKYYKRFLAVNRISLCVTQMECFGLLGVNGAGKTTVFKMLTGDEGISYGSAYVKGMNLSSNMNRIYREIGYCPQFDALLEDLTGREILRIFCLLRGIPKRQIRPISEELAKSFGFLKYIDKPIKTYSGGNKRKLSTAIAVLGSPSVIYLDEPTTGMDPVSRRQLWNMVIRIRNSGKSIILTSHSMEECEALCTRLAVMVNGEFKCIGSTQHLKNKFSKGLILKIKVKADETYSDTQIHDDNSKNESLKASTVRMNIETIQKALEVEYPKSILKEVHHGMVTFYIPLTGVKWSEIFGFIENSREYLNIEDYSVSQTTLEEIFLEFAKHQRADPRDIKQKKRRCAKCCGSRRKDID